jgi:hypothetical protein
MRCLRAAVAALPEDERRALMRWARRVSAEMGDGIGKWSVLRLLLVTGPEITAMLDALDQEVQIDQYGMPILPGPTGGEAPDKARGVLMREDSVLALIAGRKTETRRLASARPLGSIDDILYVRETWKAAYQRKSDWALQVIYRADGRQVYLAVPPDKTVQTRDAWRSARYMFRFMARYWLQIEEIIPQALQDIDPKGAIHEGIFNEDGLWYYVPDGLAYPDPVAAYAAVWDSLHRRGDKAHLWEANPEIVTYRFAVIREDPYNEV